MSMDLHQIFDQAYRSAPASRLDTDAMIRRGRRVRARNHVVLGTGVLLSAGLVALGAVATDGRLANGPAPSTAVGGGTAVPVRSVGAPCTGPTPAMCATGLGTSVTPSVAPSEGGPDMPVGPPPADLLSVSLPDPAPGFPVRSYEDGRTTISFDDGATNYWAVIFMIAGPTEPNARWGDVQITRAPLPALVNGTIEGHPVVAAPRVAGATGRVTRWVDTGFEVHDLYVRTALFSIRFRCNGDVTTAQLVDLVDALQGIG